MKVWKGIEEEGKFSSYETLFIGNYDITISQIEKIAKEHFFKQIYFGAGCCTKINYKLVRQVMKIFKRCIITLEVELCELHTLNKDITTNKNINIIVTINSREFSKFISLNKEQIQIKIQSLKGKNKYLSVCELENFEEVNVKLLNGKKYVNDVVLIK